MSKRRNQHPNKRPALDYQRLIDEVGGAKRVSEMFGELGMHAHMKTIAKWGERGRASSDGVLMLLTLTSKTKPRIDLTKYLI